MIKLQKACRNYSTWKAKHSPELKPWLYPEQNTLPRFNPADIGKWDLTTLPVLDERDVVEAVAVSDGADEDDSSGIHLSATEQLSLVHQAASNSMRGAAEQLTAEVPMAIAQPAVSEPAVMAGAN